MLHIEKIKLINKTYPGTNALSKKFEITCSDVNLFVGNQGTGKSTMLKLLQQNHSDIKLTLGEHLKTSSISSFYFDTEKDNPRMKDIQMYSNPNGTDRGIGTKNALLTRWESHGETMERMVIDAMKLAENCVVLLDEPEAGLSITNQLRLIAAIKSAVSRGCQFFIATHCYPLIQAFDVISLEHKKQMSGQEFINNCTNVKTN
jgi:predicted ATPase